MLGSPVLVQAGLPSHPPRRVVGGAPSLHTWSGVEAVAETRKARNNPGHNDRTRVGMAECEWRASLLLLGLGVLEQWHPLGKRQGSLRKAKVLVIFF